MSRDLNEKNSEEMWTASEFLKAYMETMRLVLKEQLEKELKKKNEHEQRA